MQAEHQNSVASRCFRRARELGPAMVVLAVALSLPLFALAKRESPGAARHIQLVWPPPPDDPRVAFIQHIVTPEDVGARVSGLRRFANWITGADKGKESLSKPFGVALDELDNLCITDTGANVVCYFDHKQKQWYRWDRIGEIRFASPVAVAKRGNAIFVADSALGRVIVFDTSGKLLFQISRGLERPSGLATSGERLFVADSQAHDVAIFDLQGNFISRFGGRGAGPGEFNFPTHVAADSRGQVFVTDSMNSRVQVFDTSGNFQRQFGGLGDGRGHFSRPKGLATDTSGRVYVIDALFGNFQVFDPDGRLLLDVGRPGSEPGEFWLPNGIAISRDNRIFVADAYNSRIQVLKYVGRESPAAKTEGVKR
jgi:DNA-binding beta-propeller fold protein YncE